MIRSRKLRRHSHARGRGRRGNLARCVPRLEPLEARWLLAVAWEPVEPRGGLMFQSEVAGLTGPGTQADTTTTFLEAGQSLTLVATPNDAATTLFVNLLDPSGVSLATATSPASGEPVAIQTAGIEADGTYTVIVAGNSVTDYELAMYRNAVVEVTDTNDGQEQDATASFMPLTSGRYGIVGNWTSSLGGGSSDLDEYVLDLTGKAGQSIDLVLSTEIDPISHVAFEFLDTDGTTILGTGAAVSDNFDLGIHDFVIPADGVYTVRVESADTGRYGIAVTESLVFDTEPNTPNNAPLRSLDAYDGALGYLGTASGTEVDLSLIESFEGLNQIEDSIFVPPDPIIAAGPQSVVTMVNTDIAIYDKTGTLIDKADFDGTGGFWPTNNIIFDPWVVFDPDSERFFAVGLDRSFIGAGSSRVYLAVSTDSTPTNLTTDWHKHTLDRTGTHLVNGGTTFPDYVKLGVNDDAVYITGVDFGIQIHGFSHLSMFALEKAPLLAGGPANIVYDEVITGSTPSLHPVVVHDAGAPMYFVEAVNTGGNTIRVHALTDVLGTPLRITSTVAVPAYASPPRVPQPGPGPVLATIDARFMSGVVRDGKLWTAHAVQDLAVDTETVVRWYEVDVTGFPGGPATLVQSGNVDPGPGLHTWMTHINVDNDGDMGIGFSVAGPTQFAAIGYTGRLATDAPGTTRPVEIARTSPGSATRFDGRWGDYTGLAIDPDGETFWLFNEYAVADKWATFGGSFVVEETDLREVETYTITLSAGQTIGLSTSTPLDGANDGLNLADPTLEVLDPGGVSVAFDANSGADGKNAAIPSFTAATGGQYKVIVEAEDYAVGEYVLSVNWAPEIANLAISAGMIFENESVTLTGSYSDRNVSDSHDIVVDWGDSNDSSFAVPAIDELTAGDTFSSTTDDAELRITALNGLAETVTFEVTGHPYLDDGSSPGNGTAQDTSTINVTVTDAGGLAAFPTAQEFVVNGGFETGDFTGWTVTGTGTGNWVINNGSLDPAGPSAPLPAIAGDFDAVSIQAGPAVAMLSAPIVVPTAVSSAILSWSDRIRNHASQYADPLQEWRVLVLDSGGSLIHEVFSTNPGDALQQPGPNSRSFDLTTLFQSLGGQTVQLSFEQQAQFFLMNATLDDVSLQISAAPSVLVENVEPSLVLAPVVMTNENEAAILTGTFHDPGLLDEHQLTVNWDDPNSAANATFFLPGTNSLSLGAVFNSSTDGSLLEITAVDLLTGDVGFSAAHVYADDGAAPGNGSVQDSSTIQVTLTDDDLGVAGSVPVEFITNGGFETGDFSGWTVANVGVGNWQINDGSFDPPGPGTALPPVSGNFDAVAFQGGPGVRLLTQTLVVPSDVTSAILSWSDRIRNHVAIYNDPNQEWRVLLLDAGGGLIQEVFSTSPGDVAQQVGPNGRLFDLTTLFQALGGQTVQISFQQQEAFGPFNTTLDDVSLKIGVASSVTVLVKNVEPTVSLDPVTAVDENAALTLKGSFSDQGLLDAHEVTVEWSDPNGTANSTFALPATSALIVGSSFNSVTDGAELTVTNIAGGVVSFVVEHRYLDDGTAPGNGTSTDISAVVVTVTDDDDGVGDALLDVPVTNVEPSVLLNPIASVFESGTIIVTGSFSDPGSLDEQVLTVDWDDANDTVDSMFALGPRGGLIVGDTFTSSSDAAVLTVTAISGDTVTFAVSDHQYLDDGDAPGNSTPSDISHILVTVSDDDTGVGQGSVDVQVENVIPELVPNSVVISATKDNKAEVGEVVSLSAEFTDLGVLDTHTVAIDWDDGTTSNSLLDPGDFNTFMDSGADTGSFTASHTYATGGIYKLTITVIDDDTGQVTTTTDAWISGVRTADGILQIIGTGGSDHVTINRQGNGILKVHADFLHNGNFESSNASDVDKIVAYLCEGDDHLTIAGNVDIPAIIHSGAGNDHVNAGGGPSVLLGGAGSDMLVGGGGRDFIVGGVGEDRLVGGNGGDVLIGGATGADDDDDALMQLLGVWTSPDNYETRVAAVDLLLSVTDDDDEDVLTGSAGRDLFYDGLGDVLTDLKTKKDTETVY